MIVLPPQNMERFFELFNWKQFPFFFYKIRGIHRDRVLQHIRRVHSMDSESALSVIRKDGDYQYGNDGGEDIDGLKVRLYFFAVVSFKFLFFYCSCLRFKNIWEKSCWSH